MDNQFEAAAAKMAARRLNSTAKVRRCPAFAQDHVRRAPLTHSFMSGIRPYQIHRENFPNQTRALDPEPNVGRANPQVCPTLRFIGRRTRSRHSVARF